MRGFHCMWTKPMLRGKDRSCLESRFEYEYSSDECKLPDYDILATLLSILKWKQFNGSIKLYTDSTGLRWYSELGFAHLWDEIDTETLESIDDSQINPLMFWAAGKLFAYLKEPAPCVSLDTDIFTWQNLENYYKGDLMFAHWETTSASKWYTTKERLRKPRSYEFNPNWSWAVPRAMNTSLLYFGSQLFKDYFATEAIRFMMGNSLNEIFASDVPEVVFAEQGLLALCARELKVDYRPFINAVWNPTLGYFTKHDRHIGEWIFFEPRREYPFSHVWVYKRFIENDLAEREVYCRNVTRLIIQDFPLMRDIIGNIALLQKYL